MTVYTLSDLQLLGVVLLSFCCGGGLVVLLLGAWLRHAPAAPADRPSTLWPDGQPETPPSPELATLLHDYDPRQFPSPMPIDYVNPRSRRVTAISERTKGQP